MLGQEKSQAEEITSAKSLRLKGCVLCAFHKQQDRPQGQGLRDQDEGGGSLVRLVYMFKDFIFLKVHPDCQGGKRLRGIRI